MPSSKTIVILGAAYGGNRVAQIIAGSPDLPKGWRIILVDRNTHFNHVYVMPRYAVLSGHENKAFLPLTRAFCKDLPMRENEPHVLVHAHVVSVHPHHVVLNKAFPEHDIPTTKVEFDYLVYALGAQLPDPLNLWGPLPSLKGDIPNPMYNGTKKDSVAWLKHHQKVVKSAPSVLVVGGGALGVQFASDIAHIYPEKTVTLLHSRNRLLPFYDEELHHEVMKGLESLNVNIILGERLDLQSAREEPAKYNEAGQRVVRTMRGRELASDFLMLCTGQKPNTEFLKEMDESIINPANGLAHVLRTMQLGVLSKSQLSSPHSATPREPEVLLTPATTAAVADAVSAQAPEDQLQAALEKITLADEEALKNPTEQDSEVSEEKTPAVENRAPTNEGKQENETTPYPHIFCIGDCADAFGAIKAGHTAYWQGEAAGRNVVRMIRNAEAEKEGRELEPLEEYASGPPAIKVSLGLRKAAFQVNGVVGTNEEGVDDLQAPILWTSWGYEINSDEDYAA